MIFGKFLWFLGNFYDFWNRYDFWEISMIFEKILILRTLGKFRWFLWEILNISWENLDLLEEYHSLSRSIHNCVSIVYNCPWSQYLRRSPRLNVNGKGRQARNDTPSNHIIVHIFNEYDGGGIKFKSLKIFTMISTSFSWVYQVHWFAWQCLSSSIQNSNHISTW